jgi:anthranilate phosphoribosyltransferase
VVLINASAALVAAGKADDLKTGIILAEKSIDEGLALGKLEALAAFTRKASI